MGWLGRSGRRSPRRTGTDKNGRSEFSEAIKIREPFPMMVVTRVGKVGDCEVRAPENSPTAGVAEKLFFDMQTGLLLPKCATHLKQPSGKQSGVL
jgi:hypothetical protein